MMFIFQIRCESNYNVVSFVAEPWNSFTGLSYIALAIPGVLYYTQLSIRHNINLSMHLYTLFNLAHLGFATTLFHATLQFEHQLMDKWAMHCLLSAGIVVAYTRCDPKSWLHQLNVIQSMFLGIVYWSIRENRDGIFVKGLDVVWSIYIMFGLAYLVYILQVMAVEVGKDCEKVFDQLFTSLAIAVFGWIIDILLCDVLQRQLPQQWGVPYLNYHGTLWHLGTCLAIWNIIQCQIAYQLAYEKIDVKLGYVCFVFPYVAIDDKKQNNDTVSNL